MYTPGWPIFHQVIVCLMLAGDCLARYHYPRDVNNSKPCARRRNTIIFQGVICQWDEGSRRYTEDSEINCNTSLKAECPEFNQATCEKFNDRHCCKLRYKASAQTWMEVFYANQWNRSSYDTEADRVDDIIEIHRMVRDDKVDTFGDVKQDDFPNNLRDPKGPRGLIWKDEKNPPKPYVNTSSQLCEKPNDERCEDINKKGTSFWYLMINYPNGFDKDFFVPTSAYESAINSHEKITYESWCKDTLIKRKKVPTCTTFYRRNAIPADNKSAITSFIFMESQLIVDVNGKFRLRYAYWHLETKENRDLIFRNKHWNMGRITKDQKVYSKA